MEIISKEDQQILNCLKEAVAEALERKRRLGQYAVVWRDGKPVIIGQELPNSPPTKIIDNGQLTMKKSPSQLSIVNCHER